MIHPYENLFTKCHRLIAEKRAIMRPPSYLGLARAAKASHFDCPLPSFPKPVSEPVSLIRPLGISAVENDADAIERDEDVVSAEELTELSLDPRPIVAGEEIENEPEEADDNSEPDEGGPDE